MYILCSGEPGNEARHTSERVTKSGGGRDHQSKSGGGRDHQSKSGGGGDHQSKSGGGRDYQSHMHRTPVCVDLALEVVLF